MFRRKNRNDFDEDGRPETEDGCKEETGDGRPETEAKAGSRKQEKTGPYLGDKDSYVKRLKNLKIFIIQILVCIKNCVSFTEDFIFV